MFDSYEPGARCWLPEAQAGWIGAIVKSRSDKEDGRTTRLLLETEDGSTTEVTLDASKPESLPPLRNPPALEATEDLTSLSYMNEPEVLNTIRTRHAQLNIYTFSGIVLIATNPYAQVDNLYTPEIIQSYAGMQRGERDPHLFSIAEDAYRCMVRDDKNQTIVVSGESGAGKTVSAKYIMRYFATVEDPEHPRGNTHDEELSTVEREILATNPIMEAFGNAKTSRNDNSSRFGKYLEIQFDKRGHFDICGARIRTYLLERSRIVTYPSIERNYHIFYQLLRGAPEDLKSQLGLTGVDDFFYLNQGNTVIPGVDDAKDFADTCQALSVVGITAQERIWEVLAALVHLGNINIKGMRSGVSIASDDPALLKAVELLGLNKSTFQKWLMKKQIVMRSEKIVSDLDLKTALAVRDSVAKYIYSALFDWLVSAVNTTLGAGAPPDTSFIGVLDIYGFEHFKTNSFEQFCINYANEKLQQEFNQHVFKLEQEEYKEEEIDWTYIDFVDNQPCIALIENKLGILGLLDEETRLPAGTDEGFVQKLYSQLGDKPNFSKPRIGQSAFTVSHYAHNVTYESEGFLAKNRDTVPDQIVEVLQATSNPFLKQLFDAMPDSAPAAKSSKAAQGPKRKPTLGSMFKNSLIELMDTINSTNAHYIRCIKPNEQKQAWAFDGPMVLSQLRACGVLETIRISSAGFPSRWLYEEFARRYEQLLHSSERLSTNDPQELCRRIISKTGLEPKQYQMGKTKLFLRAGLLASLENSRSKRLRDAAIILQKHIATLYHRRRYLEATASLKDFQNLVRRFNILHKVQGWRRDASAQYLQAQLRGYTQRKIFTSSRESVIRLQAVVRTRGAKKLAEQLQQENAAVDVQSLIRALRSRRVYNRDLYYVTKAQSLVRRRSALREAKKLREEQHSVRHYEEEQYRMENKVIELQSVNQGYREQIRKMENELTSLRNEHETTQRDISKNSTVYDELQTSHKNVQEQLNEAQKQVHALSTELETTRQVLKQTRDATGHKDELIEGFEREIHELREQLQATQTVQAVQASSNISRTHRPRLSQTSFDNQQVVPVAGEEAAVNNEIEKLLVKDHAARDELVSKIIRNYDVPTPKQNERFRYRDVMFPANVINLMISEMWRLGYVVESEKLIGTILRSIQENVGKFGGERMIPVGAFWMSNVQEVYSFLCLAEDNILRSQTLRSEMTQNELWQYEQLISMAKSDTATVMFNVYFMWMKEVKRIVDKMIVPAVVEEQSLPGFQQEPQTRFLSKLFTTQQQPKMDDLITLLSKVYTVLTAFHLEPAYRRQPLVELLNMIGAKAFNDMIMRKNFLTWKRAVQINYNVTRIDEWCKHHSLPEGGLSLERIHQAAKLLQLKKNYESEAGILYDICWSLTPTQIQRLMTNYCQSDYEPPIPASVHQFVARRVREDKHSSTQLLLDYRGVQDSGPFEMTIPRQLERIDSYIPANVDVPQLRFLAELTTQYSRLMDPQRHQSSDAIPETNGSDVQALPAKEDIVEPEQPPRAASNSQVVMENIEE